MKKAIALSLCLALVLGLAACGSGEPGDVTADFKRAREAASELESVHMDMDLDMSFTMSVDGQTVEMPMSMTMSMDSINEPMVCSSSITMNMFGVGLSAMNYVERSGEGYASYTSADNGATWTSEEIAEDELGRFDAAGSISFYLGLASGGFVLSSADEELDGVRAYRYDGSISGSQLNEVMDMTGMEEMLYAMTDAQTGPFEGSMPISIWLEAETFRPLRYDMDMSELMTGYVQSSLGETNGVTVDEVSATVSVRLSNFNGVGSIARPEGIA